MAPTGKAWTPEETIELLTNIVAVKGTAGLDLGTLLEGRSAASITQVLFKLRRDHKAKYGNGLKPGEKDAAKGAENAASDADTSSTPKKTKAATKPRATKKRKITAVEEEEDDGACEDDAHVKKEDMTLEQFI